MKRATDQIVEGFGLWFGCRETSEELSCVPSCKSVKTLVACSSASAKIRLPIWPLWKLSFSCEVCHSAFFCSPRSSAQPCGVAPTYQPGRVLPRPLWPFCLHSTASPPLTSPSCAAPQGGNAARKARGVPAFHRCGRDPRPARSITRPSYGMAGLSV